MSEVIDAIVKSDIVMRVDEVDPILLARIKGALTLEDEDRAKAIALRKPGAHMMAETIELWRQERHRDGQEIIRIPRGFSRHLMALVMESGYTIRWEDRRTSAVASEGYYRPFLLYDTQLRDATAMMLAEQGTYMAPTGSGKTITILGLLSMVQQRAIVVVDKAFLMEQWRERAASFLGLSLDLSDERSVGQIGDDIWEERDLTIALRQTLHSRLWEIQATDVFSRYGVLVLDEVHHLAMAETLQDVVREAPCRMILGPSATPARSPMQGQIVNAIIGPIVAETTRNELYERGRLVRPTVEVVETDLEATFWGDHESDADGNCDKPGCNMRRYHTHRNNWQSCLKKLVEDDDRNRLIAERIASERGHVHLVSSRQLKHLNLLRRAIEESGWDGSIYFLRGEENAEGESQQIVRAIEAGGRWEQQIQKVGRKKERVWVQVEPHVEGEPMEAVILSTVADEGMDIPMIARLHVVYPLRQEAATIQLVGRCERVCEGKEGAVVIDYHDHRVPLFSEQYADRARTYRVQGLATVVKTA